jgi:predicted PurR-regulated permease PerM
VTKITLHNTIEVLLLGLLVFAAIYFLKPFLVPVCFAGIFAMLFLPLSRKFESVGINKGLSALLCVIIFILIIGGIILLLSWQISDLIKDLGNIEQKIKTTIEQAKKFISEKLDISNQQQQKIIDDQSKNTGSMVQGITAALMTVVVDFILVLVYIFLFLYYRSHIKEFILHIVPKNSNSKDALAGIEKVSQQYLTGLGLMIICLWIMYGIGFSIVGLENPIFFAIICGLFEIVPFVGNITGNALALLMAITQGGGMPMVTGILITYAIVQFLQSYFLETLVVGNEVNVNPLFTIIGLVLGEFIWGIPGLMLAIPLLGITKIICDHTPQLKPLGKFIGSQKKKENKIVDKIKKLFS